MLIIQSVRTKSNNKKVLEIADLPTKLLVGVIGWSVSREQYIFRPAQEMIYTSEDLTQIQAFLAKVRL